MIKVQTLKNRRILEAHVLGRQDRIQVLMRRVDLADGCG